ncbi:hypothetical protein PI125_g26207 [Phytophthora idaei]|nr:hypothetical protein PI125_g26207 [Phytophthora idaei]
MLRLLVTSSGTTVACGVSDADTPGTLRVSAQRLCTRPGADVAMPGIAAINKKTREPVGAGRPTGSAVTRVYNGHAALKTAAPSERDSHCKKQDDKPNLVILKIRSKRENSLRALVDSGASNNFVRQQSLSKLNFEDVDTPRSALEVRLATGATVRTEKRVVRVRFSYKHRVFVENLIVLDLDDKFDLVLGMPWLARHDPVVIWEKRTLVRFGRNATEIDGPVSVAHAQQGASDHLARRGKTATSSRRGAPCWGRTEFCWASGRQRATRPSPEESWGLL